MKTCEKHHNSIRLTRELIDVKSHWASSLVICADFACTSVSNCEIRCKSCSCSYCQNLPGNIMVTVLFTWRPGMVEILKPARNKLLGEAGCWLSMLQKKWTNPDKSSSKKHSRNDSIATDINWPVNQDWGYSYEFLYESLGQHSRICCCCILICISLQKQESPKTYLFAVDICYFDLFCESVWFFLHLQNKTA